MAQPIFFLISGADKVDITPSADTLSATIKSKKKSDAKDDITVQVSTNSRVIAEKKLTVFVPGLLTRLDWNDNADGTWGYESFIHYRIKDQFNTNLSKNIELNEQWNGAIVADYTGMNWRRGPEGAATVAPMDWSDHIQGETSDKTPTPLGPVGGAGWIAVYHWPGTWAVGGLDIGKGVPLLKVSWDKSRGHGRHSTLQVIAP